MPRTYTHTFEISFGSLSLGGEIEFNVDEKTSYKTDRLVEMSLDESEHLNDLFTILHKIGKNFGTITKIEINQKP